MRLSDDNAFGCQKWMVSLWLEVNCASTLAMLPATFLQMKLNVAQLSVNILTFDLVMQDGH